MRALLAALVLAATVAGVVVAAGGDRTRLPLGDGRVSTDGPRRGWVYACRIMTGGPGAFRDGEWIRSDGTFDLTAKPTVDGSVRWPAARVSISRRSGRVRITGNGLPKGATTGTFPIARSDDAFEYDRNPNSIAAQTVSLTLPRPKRASTPGCLSLGPVGYAVNGVAIFNALDAQSRDAVAHEIQDTCGGHPERRGTYHYHSGSDCLTRGRAGTILVGWMIDGHPLVREPGITNADLDVCHGRTSTIRLFGRRVRTYHYNVTDEYPYTIGCFRGGTLRAP